MGMGVCLYMSLTFVIRLSLLAQRESDHTCQMRGCMYEYLSTRVSLYVCVFIYVSDLFDQILSSRSERI